MKYGSNIKWHVVFGLFFTASLGQAARATSLIYGKTKAAQTQNATAPEDEGAPTAEAANSTITNGNMTIKLTGIPQIDYVHDPNLPRELNGANLTDYPFYNSIPEEIDFKCDGLHDGFYASVIHKCQVYHHCLFGTRYDFLCANYTAFDQKTFICHFASEVDCKNSPKFFKRNEALYKQDSTTAAPTTTTAKPPPREPTGRRRPYRRRKPVYEYDEEYEDYSEDYEDDRRGKKGKPQGKEPESGEADELPSGPNKAIYDRPRVAPKIRRPVPVNEREKYDYSGDSRVIPTKSAPREDEAMDEKTDNGKRKNKTKITDGPVEGGKRDRYRERDRYRGRDDERDEDDRELPRRRPSKKRKRPEYDYYEDEYDEVPRRKNRDRVRYEVEDYEYDDRYYRKPLRSRERERDRELDRDRIRDSDRDRIRDPDRDLDRDRIRDSDRDLDRDRIRDAERDLERDRVRDSDRDSDRDRNRERDFDRDRYRGKVSEERPSKPNKYDDEEDEVRYSSREEKKSSARGRYQEDEEPPRKQESSSKRDETTQRSNQDRIRRPTQSEEAEKDESSHASREIIADKSKEVTQRTKFVPRKRVTTPRPSTEEAEVEEMPSIEEVSEVKVTEPPSRKVLGTRRTTTAKYVEDEESSISGETSREESVEKQSEPPRNTWKKKIPSRMTSSEEIYSSTTEKETSKLKVPLEADEETLAPRAPKIQMSSKRRPFLPSRGGDSSALRGLTPVGPKTSPRPENSRPTGIEFRTRVQANLGVEQPPLSVQEDEDYSGEETDEETGPVRTSFGLQDAAFNTRTEKPVPLRPTLRPSDFGGDKQEPRKYSSKLPQNADFTEPKLPIQQFFGPQTFFSENPKFQTSLPENRARPNFGQQFAPYQPLIKPGQGQVQVVHFPKTPEYNNRRQIVRFSNENIPEEYDVAFNDALQPVSSLQPRNAQSTPTQKTSGSTPVPRRAVPTLNYQSYIVPMETRIGQRQSATRLAESVVRPQYVSAPDFRNLFASYR